MNVGIRTVDLDQHPSFQIADDGGENCASRECEFLMQSSRPVDQVPLGARVPEWNNQVAAKLYEVAALLAAQGANPFRVNAFRRAAATIARLPRDIRKVVEAQGPEGLVEIPDVGRGIAAVITELVATGRCSRLDRLRGELDSGRLFQSVPGVGAALAARIHDALHIDTLEELEVAAHDGRLEGVPGIGRRRVAAIRASLAAMLGRLRTTSRAMAAEPPVAMILAVDGEYRRKSARGELALITPRRFNPGGEAWLPVLHTQRGGWHFTALYSNTARAHALGHCHDWVVVYYYDHDHHEYQCTVVTEFRGPLEGKRVVRGREAECRDLYGKSVVAAT